MSTCDLAATPHPRCCYKPGTSIYASQESQCCSGRARRVFDPYYECQ